MLFGTDETARVKFLQAGDELILEEKINEFLAENPDKSLADLKVNQIKYHSRMGADELALMAVLVLRVKK